MTKRSLLRDDALHDYVLANSLREHPEQIALRLATQSHPRAGMQIAPEQGQFMALLIKLIGAKRAIEVGVFTGYSALSVALALPADGRLLACDITDDDVNVGKPYWARAGVAEKIDLRIAPASQTLAAACKPVRRGSTTSRSSTPTRPATTATTSRCCNCCGSVAS